MKLALIIFAILAGTFISLTVIAYLSMLFMEWMFYKIFIEEDED